MMKGL